KSCKSCSTTHLTAHNGNLNRASQPLSCSLFSSVNVPPCASAICRDSTNPIPDPCAFVVKNGTNRFAVLASPGPSSRTHTSTCPFFCCQPTSTLPRVSIDASTALRTRLISNCSSWTSSPRTTRSGPATTFTCSRCSKFATRDTSAPIFNGSSRGGGRRASFEYDSTKRASESALDEITARPRCMSSRQSGGSGSLPIKSARLPATDLIGASELLSSWPNTRNRRCQAVRSSSRSV